MSATIMTIYLENKQCCLAAGKLSWSYTRHETKYQPMRQKLVIPLSVLKLAQENTKDEPAGKNIPHKILISNDQKLYLLEFSGEIVKRNILIEVKW